MTRRSPLAAAAALFATLLLASPAQAQRAPSSIAGAWTFETDARIRSGCVISGTAHVARTRTQNRFSVQLVANERCLNGSRWRAIQNCAAAQNAHVVRIACRIVEARPSNYRADNFDLTVRSAGYMEGLLVSNLAWRVRWRRDESALIS
jgi:hypothetical protein